MTTTTTTPTIDSVECRRLLDADPTLRIIDVRTGGEYESVHIPGSYNVPLDMLSDHAADLASLEQPIVLVCQSGARASQANAALCAEGTNNLLLLDGGIAAWQAAGGEVNRGTTETWALDRQVRLAAGAIAFVAVLASTVYPAAKWIAAGVGAGLSYSAISNTCAMGNMLAKLPYNRSGGQDVASVIAALRTGEAAQ